MPGKGRTIPQVDKKRTDSAVLGKKRRDAGSGSRRTIRPLGKWPGGVSGCSSGGPGNPSPVLMAWSRRLGYHEGWAGRAADPDGPVLAATESRDDRKRSAGMNATEAADADASRLQALKHRPGWPAERAARLFIHGFGGDWRATRRTFPDWLAADRGRSATSNRQQKLMSATGRRARPNRLQRPGNSNRSIARSSIRAARSAIRRCAER